MKPTGCPETLMLNYHCTLRNIPEGRRFHLRRGGGLNHAFVSVITENTLHLPNKISLNISEKNRCLHLLETDGGSRLLQNITKYLKKQTASDTKQHQTTLFTNTAFCSSYFVEQIKFFWRIARWNYKTWIALCSQQNSNVSKLSGCA